MTPRHASWGARLMSREAPHTIGCTRGPGPGAGQRGWRPFRRFRHRHQARQSTPLSLSFYPSFAFKKKKSVFYTTITHIRNEEIMLTVFTTSYSFASFNFFVYPLYQSQGSPRAILFLRQSLLRSEILSLSRRIASRIFFFFFFSILRKSPFGILVPRGNRIAGIYPLNTRKGRKLGSIKPSAFCFLCSLSLSLSLLLF